MVCWESEYAWNEGSFPSLGWNNQPASSSNLCTPVASDTRGLGREPPFTQRLVPTLTAYLVPGQRRVTAAPPWSGVTAKRVVLRGRSA